MTETKQLLPGSATGPSYLLIGRRGDIALGVKMLGVVPDPGGNPSRAYLACRVRSANYGGDMEHPDQEVKVVSMAEHSLTFESAWPGIKFSKVDGHRASAIVGVYTRADLRKDPAGAVKDAIEGGHIEQLVAFIADAAGAEHLVLRQGAVTAWAKGELAPVLARIIEKQAAQKKYDEATEGLIGIAGFQAEQLKALLNEQPEEDPPPVLKKKTPGPAEFGSEENPD